jgi:hypothetical protein
MVHIFMSSFHLQRINPPPLARSFCIGRTTQRLDVRQETSMRCQYAHYTDNKESHNSELEARDDIAMMTETLTDRYKARLLARCS